MNLAVQPLSMVLQASPRESSSYEYLLLNFLFRNGFRLIKVAKIVQRVSTVLLT